MRRVCLFITLLLCSQAFRVQSAEHLDRYQHRIYNNETQYIPSSQVMVFRDDSNSLGYEDVKELGSSYFISLDEIEVFAKSNTYWVSLSISNYSERTQSLIVFTGDNSYSTIYIEKNGVLDSLKTGYFVPMSKRDLKKGFQSKFRLNLEDGETASLLVKTKSLDNYPPRFNFRTVQSDKWNKTEQSWAVLEGVFTGILVVLSILGVSLYFYIKKPVFLYYGLFSAINTIYFLYFYGYLDAYLFPEQPHLTTFLWLLPNLSAVFYFAFSRHFLNTSDLYPKWDKFFKGTIGLMSLSFIFSSIYILLTQDVYSALIVHNLLNIIVSLSVVIFILSLRRLSNIELRYFAIASVFLITIGLFASAQYVLNLESKIIPYVQLGVVIEVVLFALGLGHKLKKLVENHAITQESLIIQLIENEKLQGKTNAELKEKVAERTHQINVQNIELNKAREIAEKATKSKSDFLSVMSHEIRTPLNAIISLSHLMDIDNENKETQEYIDALKFSAESLSSLINDILDYNKIEAGKLKLEKIDFSLIDLLKNIRDSFKFKAKSKNVSLEFSLAENMPNRLIGDPTRLTQVFNNLISNALKFTDDGRIGVSAVLLGIENERVEIEFSVSDTGIGIPADKIKEIFKDFEQASSETTRKYGGTGLGLAITQKLLEMHDSAVEVSSVVGEGTEFKFAIKFELPEQFDLMVADKIDTDHDLKKAEILVVDDNYMNRMVLNRLFNKWNATFHEASSGKQALAKSDAQKYDLILMDIHMDEMDGFECTTLIKDSSKLNQNTRIIGMSAFAKNELEGNLKRDALYEFITKPFDPKELLNKLVYYLNYEEAK